MFTFTKPNSGSTSSQWKFSLQLKGTKKGGTEENSKTVSYKRPPFLYMTYRSSEIYSGNIYIFGVFKKHVLARSAIHTIFSIDKNIFHILDHTLSLLNSWLLAGWERRKFHLHSPHLPLFFSQLCKAVPLPQVNPR